MECVVNTDFPLKVKISRRTESAPESAKAQGETQRNEGNQGVKTADRGCLCRFSARVVAEALRRVYQWTGWRPSDGTLCRLGHRLRGLQHLPVRMADGRTLYLDLRNPVSVPYLLEGEFPPERNETLLARDLVSRGDTAVDIGANVGWYASLLCHGVGEEGRVHAFEPNPFLAELLESLARECPYLTVHPVALSDREGESEFFIPDNWVSGSLRRGGESARSCRVEVARLDDVLSERPDFIKLDAEGAEMEVLAGARETLDAPDAPIWMVELSTREARPFGHEICELVDLFRQAARARYDAYRIDPDQPRLFPLELPSDGDFWMNALFVPAGRRDKVPARWFAPRG